MDHTHNSIVYTVNSDLDDEILYAEFDTKEEAIEYAKRNLDKLPFVDELHVSRDVDGEIDDVFEYKTIWDHTMADDTKEETEDEYWDDLEAAHDAEEDGKHVIGDTTWFESMNNLVETLEENEEMVECKECFELYPKSECIKLPIGYICPICAEGGTVSEEDIFKMDFPECEKMPTENDMIPDECKEENSSAEAEDETDPMSTPEEVIPFLVKDEEEAIAGYEQAEKVINDSDVENKEEVLKVLDHIKGEEEEHIEELTGLTGVIAGNDTDTEVIEDNVAVDDNTIIEVEDEPEQAVEETNITEAFEAARLTKDELYDRLVNKAETVELDIGDQHYSPADVGSFSDGGYYGGSILSIEFENGLFEAAEFYTSESGAIKEGYWYFETNSFDDLWDEIMKTFKPEELVEHINDRAPAIESDQKLHGVDNAVVDCKVAKVVAHSEDEKPVDCLGEKKPLEKPLTEAKLDPFHEAIFEAIDYLTEFDYMFPIPDTLAADTWVELKDDINYGLSSDFEIAEILMEYLEHDLEISKKHPEIFEDDPQSELTLETYERLKKAYDRAVADYKAAHAEDFTEATHAKYAKPEGDRKASYNNALKYAKKDGVPYIYGYTGLGNKFFALEQPIKVAGDISEAEAAFRGRYKNCQTLHVAYPDKSFVESYDFTADEMKEYQIDEDGNSLTGYDTWVRCNWCRVPKPESDCVFEINLGWLCRDCQQEVRTHGGALTIKDYPTEEDIARTLDDETEMSE